MGHNSLLKNSWRQVSYLLVNPQHPGCSKQPGCFVVGTIPAVAFY